MAVEQEDNCAARVLSVHDRGLRRRRIEEWRQLQRWKDGDLRTTYIVMAERPSTSGPDDMRRAFGCMPLVSSKDRATWASIAKGES